MIADFFKIKKTNDLGMNQILKLLLEYLTRISVIRDIDITSTNLEKEYIKGIIT